MTDEGTTAEDALGETIEHATAAAAGAAEGDRWPWWFVRCWLHLERSRRDGGIHGAELDAAEADFARLPLGAPGRQRLAAAVVRTRLASGTSTAEQIDAVAAPAEVADEEPGSLPEDAARHAAVRALQLTRSLQIGQAGVDPRSVLAGIGALERATEGAQPSATVVAGTRLGAEHLIRAAGGDIAGNQDLVDRARRLAEQQAAGSPQSVRTTVPALTREARAALSRGDMTTASARFRAAVAVRDQLPPGDVLGAALDEALSSISALRHLVDGSVPNVSVPNVVVAWAGFSHAGR